MSRTIMQQGESKRHFKVGSCAFFEEMPGFCPSDVDEVEFEEDPKLYRNFMQFRKTDKKRCLFKWRKMTADEFVDYTINTSLPMEIGKFLVPEVAEYIGFTIEHLRKLKPVADRLDSKHGYEKIIYDAYIRNNGFTLTQEDRNCAYAEYLKPRENN